MKKQLIEILVVIGAVAFLFAVGTRLDEANAQATKTDAIPWQTSFDSALQLAKQQGKPVLLDFYNPK